MRKICPVNGINYNKRQDKELWGPNYGVYKGWSLDDKIRYEAASPMAELLPRWLVFLLKQENVML